MDGMDIGPDNSADQRPTAVSVEVRLTTLNPRVQGSSPWGRTTKVLVSELKLHKALVLVYPMALTAVLISIR